MERDELVIGAHGLHGAGGEVDRRGPAVGVRVLADPLALSVGVNNQRVQRIVDVLDKQ